MTVTNQESVQTSILRIRREVSNRERHYYTGEGFRTKLPDSLTLGQLQNLRDLVFEHFSANGFTGKVDTLVIARIGASNIEFHVREDEPDSPYRAAGRLNFESAIAWLHTVQRAQEPLIWDQELIIGRVQTTLAQLHTALGVTPVDSESCNWFISNPAAQRKVGQYITKYIREYYPGQNIPSLRVSYQIRQGTWRISYVQDYPKNATRISGSLDAVACDDVSRDTLVRIALYLKDVPVESLTSREPVL